MDRSEDGRALVPALKVSQWFCEWNEVPFDQSAHRAKPEPHFYLFSLEASTLKKLTGIRRRSAADGKPRASDLGIQRYHDEARSQEIAEYVRYGYPWSQLSIAKRDSGQFADLRKPGWLPTAIVVNILAPGTKRGRRELGAEDAIEVRADEDRSAVLALPVGCMAEGWDPTVRPVEVIDGQHRLWAFEEGDDTPDFELPVVAFHNLDVSWQAYLFWTINIKPKKINASLAYDLYPLLRTEDWLDRFEGHSVYRETRAQELVEALWLHPESPWHNRINMLGEKGRRPMLSQAAWIRSLMATFVKASGGPRVQIGGLFGSRAGEAQMALPWSRAMQAAFLIVAWQKVQEAVAKCHLTWAEALRSEMTRDRDQEDEPAFFGEHALICQDPGVRGVLYIVNDLCFIRADELELADWGGDVDASPGDSEALSRAVASFSTQRAAKFLGEVAEALTHYDWRSSDADDLSEDRRREKLALRGSGGYGLLRQELLKCLAGGTGTVAKTAADARDRLGYTE